MNNNKLTIDFYPNNFIIDLRVIVIPQKKSTNLFKLILISLISLSLITASAFYVHAQVNAGTSGGNSTSAQNNIIQNVVTSVKMTATVPGWFKATQTSNERLDVTTNMQVFVNGKKMAPVAN